MSRRAGLAVIGVVFVALLGVALWRTPEPVKAAEDRGFDSKVAIKVIMKNHMFEYLTHPEIRRVGGRAFIYGWRQGAPGAAWLPVEDVVFIEEHSSLEEMLKVYPGLAPKKN